MPTKLIVNQARITARAFCDSCGEIISDASLAHCAYPESARLLIEREGESYAFNILHKGQCTELFELTDKRFCYLELESFLVRLDEGSGVDWTLALANEDILRTL